MFKVFDNKAVVKKIIPHNQLDGQGTHKACKRSRFDPKTPNIYHTIHI